MNIEFKIKSVDAMVSVAERATALNLFNPHNYDRVTMMMDLAAADADVGLDYDKLLAFPDYDFAHDVIGIATHMNRNTGKIEDFFLPRSAKLEA